VICRRLSTLLIHVERVPQAAKVLAGSKDLHECGTLLPLTMLRTEARHAERAGYDS